MFNLLMYSYQALRDEVMHRMNLLYPVDDYFVRERGMSRNTVKIMSMYGHMITCVHYRLVFTHLPLIKDVVVLKNHCI